ncbi:MAG: hypothetical protein M1827_001211 [Pycnora praestabilis]|nr:MAG: hypothetical protein M1827_001211 [Pycnora praestabilis]
MSDPTPPSTASHNRTGSNMSIPPLSNFLVLSPVHSDSFPTSPKSKPSTTNDSAILSPSLKAGAGPSVDEISDLLAKTRRSSSTSSSNSSEKGTPKFRFLKLGPVHWGGEQGMSDFAEE